MATGKRAHSQAATGASVGCDMHSWQVADALREQQAETEKLDAAIDANLKALGYGR